MRTSENVYSDPAVVIADGIVVGEHYVIVKTIHVGGMSSVYQCYRIQAPEKLLGLKVLHSYMLDDEIAVQRFQSEILASYEVDHENVVQCLEYIRTSNIMAYSMEFVSGGDLRRRIERGPLFTFTEMLTFSMALCSGLQEVHESGIIHRDIKPKNILITEKGRPKIADFGIALFQGGRRLTNHGDIVGAIDYVSPEYLETGEIDFRSDIYAMGLVMYEIITGQPAFPKGNTPVDSLMRRLTHSAPEPRELRAECPGELADVVTKALSRLPEDRYQSAAEMEEALRGVKALVERESDRTRRATASLRGNKTIEEEPPHLSLVRSGERVAAPQTTVSRGSIKSTAIAASVMVFMGMSLGFISGEFFQGVKEIPESNLQSVSEVQAEEQFPVMIKYGVSGEIKTQRLDDVFGDVPESYSFEDQSLKELRLLSRNDEQSEEIIDGLIEELRRAENP